MGGENGWNGEAGVLRIECFETGAKGLRVLLVRKSVAKRLVLLASCSDSSIQRVCPEIFRHSFRDTFITHVSNHTILNHGVSTSHRRLHASSSPTQIPR